MNGNYKQLVEKYGATEASKEMSRRGKLTRNNISSSERAKELQKLSVEKRRKNLERN